MAKNTRLAISVVNAQADVLASFLKNGFIDIFDGPQPEGPEAEIGNNTLCVTLRFNAPAFAPAIMGVISSNPIQQGKAIANVDRASWARLYREDHKTAVMDVSVGDKDGDANIVLPTTRIARNVMVALTSFTYSVPKLGQ